MKMPFADVCDRYTIVKLKQQHTKDENIIKQVKIYKDEIDTVIKDQDEVKQVKIQGLLLDLEYANKKVWDAEGSLREAIDDNLPAEEYKWRTIITKQGNKLRHMFKNMISDLVNESEFKDVKVDHGSM